MQMIKPDNSSPESKKRQVEDMFDSIAPRYDFLNSFLSAGIDSLWRKKAMGILKSVRPRYILDVATGTGALALEAYRMLKPEKITGIDIAEQMLAIGREKVKKMGLEKRIELLKGDSENLPFADNSFDAVTVAFGVRNFENLEGGLTEMKRVLKPGGKIVILEFSTPRSFLYKQVYHLYFSYILPLWGRLISKSKNAYTYLPESVKHFPEGEGFVAYLRNCGFRDILAQPLTFGTCTLYTAEK